MSYYFDNQSSYHKGGSTDEKATEEKATEEKATEQN
jgi:hypothetical protein